LFFLGKEVDSSHSKISSANFNLNEKRGYIFHCDCQKEMVIKKETKKNIIDHIKQCSACCVMCEFDEFIYTRSGNSEAFLVKKSKKRPKESNPKVKILLKEY
jgi:hypothetical protein